MSNEFIDHLKSLLTITLDEKNPSFQAAHDELVSFQESDPEVALPQIFELLQDETLTTQQIFLSLVILKHIVTEKTIPLSDDHPYLELVLRDEFVITLLQISYHFFPHPDVTVRNAASSLCSSVFMTQKFRLNEIEVIPTLFSFITEVSSIEALEPTLECLCFIIGMSHSSEQLKIELLPKVLELFLQFKENPPIFTKCIDIFRQCISNFKLYFPSNESLIELNQHVIELLQVPIAKHCIYGFLSDLVGMYPMSVFPFFDDYLLPLLQTDIVSNEDQLVIDVLVFINTMLLNPFFQGQNENEESKIPQLIDTFLQTTIDLMTHFNYDEILSYEEWKPYENARTTLDCFIRSSQEIVAPLLTQFIDDNTESEDPKIREIIMKILTSIFTNCSQEFIQPISDDSFAVILQGLQDSSIRVVYYALEAYSFFVRRFADTSEPFIEVLSQLPTLLTEEQNELNLQVFRVVLLIISIPDFNNIEIFQQIIEGFLSFPTYEIIQNLFCLFIIFAQKEIDSNYVNQLIDIIFTFIQQWTEEIPGIETREELFNVFQHLSEAFYSFSKLIPFTNDSFTEYVPQILEFSFAFINEYQNTSPLIVLSALLGKHFALDHLSDILTIFSSALEELETEEVNGPAIKCAPMLLVPDLIGDAFSELFLKFIHFFSHAKGVDTKNSIIDSLIIIFSQKYPIVCNGPFVYELLCIIQQLIFAIGDVCQKYHTKSCMFISKILELLCNLLLIETHDQNKFSICQITIFFINGILKLQDIYQNRSIVAQVCSLISLLTNQFRPFAAETLQQVPYVLAFFQRHQLKEPQLQEEEE